jgi:hypothetical protein
MWGSLSDSPFLCFNAATLGKRFFQDLDCLTSSDARRLGCCIKDYSEGRRAEEIHYGI